MARERIIVVGSANTDLIIRLPRLPKSGETLLGGKFFAAAGGKGANQAVGAARAGGRVIFIGRVGSDSFGHEAIAGLRRDGIDVSQVKQDRAAPSGTALILVGAKGQNMIAVASGANARLSPSDIRSASRLFTSAGALVVQLESPLATVAAALQIAHRNRVPVILNPAPARALPRRLLAQVSILTPNETEAELLTGITINSDGAAERAADRLLGWGVKVVIITLGARGAFVATERIQERIASPRVRAVDTTAAGDVFTGALAVACVERQPLLAAVRFANAAAALSVTRVGAQSSAPTRREIERRLRS